MNMKIDIRTDTCVYVEIEDKTFYIDDSTGEAIMECWQGPLHDQYGSYTRNVKTLAKQYATPYMQQAWEKANAKNREQLQKKITYNKKKKVS